MTDSTYIWYSGATDVTGKNLAEALNANHGNKMPVNKEKVVICWGAKTSEDVVFPTGTLVLNHPNSIRRNRNKYEALQIMKNAGVNVASFCAHSTKEEMANAGVVLPVIGRTRYHQGGKGFWTCPTMTHVLAAVTEGADYFQNMIEIRDEYRIHVVGDKVIHAVKKTKRSVAEMEEAFIKHERERQIKLAEKNGDKLDEVTMDKFLARQAKKFAQDGANMLIRSNRLGWKFAKVKAVPKELESEAIKACSALNLDYGAVDCCTDADGKHWIIEVNTGPGLEESTFKAWVTALEGLIESKLGPVKTIKKATKKAEDTPTKKTNVKEGLAKKLALAQEMVENADEDEAVVLNNVFKKMFG